jgi:hypothetical protein
VNEDKPDTRQERRAEKLRKKRAQVKKHSKNLAKVYMDVILKRLRYLR